MNDWPYPFWIAHRGAGKLAPENTLAAFRLGAEHGYRAFECDAKLSADGVVFLLHDPTLQRTTPGRGVAGERPWSELSQLDAGGWHSRRYAGEPLPTLASLASFCLANGHALNIEIKPTPGQESETGRAVAREAARLWRDAQVKPLLTSFSVAALEAAREAEPTLTRGLLLDSLASGWLEQAERLGCRAIVANYAALDAAAIERMHGAGIKAMAYTVNDAVTARWLLSVGIDAIITDAVDQFSPQGPAVTP